MGSLKVTSASSADSPNVIRLEGPLNRETVPNAWPQQSRDLSDISGKDIQLDLHKVSHIDTAGLAWLVHVYKECRQRSLALTIINSPPSLHKLAKISNVEALLPLQ